MTSTVVFTKRDKDQHFTLREINDYFTWVADIINNKLDRLDPEVVESLHCNLRGVINVADGVADTDAMTVAQAKELIGG